MSNPASSAAVSTTPARLDCFDFLRLFAALSVALSHTIIHLNGGFFFYTVENNEWHFDGVLMFFIMSGLMVYRSGENCATQGRSWWSFYANRALRILPAIYLYTVVIVIILAITGFITAANITSTPIIAFIASNLGLVNVYSPAAFADFGVGNPNGSLWTIPVEVSFYVVVPLLVVMSRKLGWRVTNIAIWVVAILGLIASGLLGGMNASSLIGQLFGITFVPYLFAFWTGVNLKKYWNDKYINWWWFAAAIVVYFVIQGLGHGQSDAVNTWWRGVSIVPLAYIVMCFGKRGPGFLARWVRKLGDLSFSVYIWHMVVVNVLIELGLRDSGLNGTLKVSISLAISLVIAYLSWHLLEKQALKRKPYTTHVVNR